MGQSKPFHESFDQLQIEMIQRAIDRAWDVVKHTETEQEADSRDLLAICVMNEARAGEENHIKLVNRAINRFRVQRSKQIFESRRQEV